MDKAMFRNALGRLIGETGKALAMRLEKNVAEAGFDLSAPQVILLAHIEEAEGINQQTLTNHLARDKTAITRCIDSLEDKNLVVRVPDKTDRRQNMIYLTQKGKEAVPELIKMAQKTDAEAIQGIPPQEVDTIKEELRKIQKNLTE